MVGPNRFFKTALSPIRASVLISILFIGLVGTQSTRLPSANAATHVGASAQVPMGGTLVIDNESGALWTGNYSPFSPAVNFTSIGVFYEPLMFVNIMNGQVTPWLASAYRWGAGNRSLTFTIRHGVQWSDGKPFTAADVAFTFNLEKKFPGIDLQAVWSVLKSVQVQGADKVVFTFSQPAVPYFYNIADLNGIVAQHVWSSIKDPVTYTDAHPVGTGPFILGPASSPQTIEYDRNPHYWQVGKPYLDKVLYPAFTSNPAANLLLAQGKADWGGQFIPNIDAYYISRDRANNHYWFPPIGNVNLYINQTVAGLNNRSVRQAMAFAIDRTRVSKIGEYGYEPPANQSGVLLPNFANWQDKGQTSTYNYTYDPQKAIGILQKAGFKKNGSGIFQSASGKPLSFSVINVGGNTDWVTSLQIITFELKAIGIDVTIKNLSQTDYSNRLYNGSYDLAYGTPPSPGPNPYYEMRQTLCSCNSAPIGKPASSNFERWNDPKTDALFNQFAATSDSAKQHAIVDQLQTIMLRDVPVIPVTEGVAWFQYSTAKFSGWPAQGNVYAVPAPYAFPDWEVTLTHLHLK